MPALTSPRFLRRPRRRLAAAALAWAGTPPAHRLAHALLHLLAWIFLLLVCIGSVSNEPVVREVYFLHVNVADLAAVVAGGGFSSGSSGGSSGGGGGGGVNSTPDGVATMGTIAGTNSVGVDGRVSARAASDPQQIDLSDERALPPYTTLAQTLGLHDFYQVGLWCYCAGYLHVGITYCSPRRTLYAFNPVNIIFGEMFAGSTIALPPSITKPLSIAKTASRWMFSLYLSAAVLSFVSIFLSLLIVHPRPLPHLLPSICPHRRRRHQQEFSKAMVDDAGPAPGNREAMMESALGQGRQRPERFVQGQDQSHGQGLQGPNNQLLAGGTQQTPQTSQMSQMPQMMQIPQMQTEAQPTTLRQPAGMVAPPQPFHPQFQPQPQFQTLLQPPPPQLGPGFQPQQPLFPVQQQQLPQLQGPLGQPQYQPFVPFQQPQPQPQFQPQPPPQLHPQPQLSALPPPPPPFTAYYHAYQSRFHDRYHHHIGSESAHPRPTLFQLILLAITTIFSTFAAITAVGAAVVSTTMFAIFRSTFRTKLSQIGGGGGGGLNIGARLGRHALAFSWIAVFFSVLVFWMQFIWFWRVAWPRSVWPSPAASEDKEKGWRRWRPWRPSH